MVKISILILTFSLSLYSCSKNKKNKIIESPEIVCGNLAMNGDLARLVGKWKWKSSPKSLYSLVNCFKQATLSEVTPQSYGVDFFIDIDKNGILKFFKGDTLINVYFFSSTRLIFVDNFNVLTTELNYNCSTNYLDLKLYSDSELLINFADLNFNTKNQSEQTGNSTFEKL